MREDRRAALISQSIDAGFSISRTIIIAGAIIWVGSFIRDVLVSWGGKETTANLAFQLISKIQLDRWAAYAFGALAGGYGYAQKKLRERTIRRLSNDLIECQKRHDKKRTSSGLTPTGRTRREDR